MYHIIYETTCCKNIFTQILKREKIPKTIPAIQKNDECWTIKVMQIKPKLWLYRNQSIESYCNSLDWFLYIHNIDLISVASRKEYLSSIFIQLSGQWIDYTQASPFSCTLNQRASFCIIITVTWCGLSQHIRKS